MGFTFCIGIRDILIHQIFDAKNDELGGVKTFATSLPKSAINLVHFANIVGAVLIVTLLSLVYIKQQQLIWLMSAALLAISYLYQFAFKKTQSKLNNDYLIQNYIIITSLLFIYIILKKEVYWLLVLVAHPYFMSFVLNKIFNNIKLVSKCFLKIVIGNLLLTYLPIIINNLLFYVFKIFGRDLKQNPLYKRENEISLLKKIRAKFQ